MKRASIMRWRLLVVPALLAWMAAAGAAEPLATREPSLLPEPFQQAGVDEKLGNQISPDLVFTNSEGQQVRLGDYFGQGRPLIVTFVYYECPMLCTLILNGLTDALKEVALEPGRDFEILTISFDPSETPDLATAKRNAYLKAYDREGAETGWHWHVGDDAEIQRLADQLGFRFYYDEQQQDYAHQAVMFVLTPEGRISRYLYGVMFEPRDVRLALLEAGREHIASTIDRIILFCYHYDPDARGYTLMAWNLMRLGGVMTLGVLGIFLGGFWLREWRRGRPQPDQGDRPPPRTFHD